MVFRGKESMFLIVGSTSPVNIDSLIVRLFIEIKRRSAGTTSPVFK